MRTAAVALIIAGPTAHAAPTAAPVRAEIDALLTRLEASGCRFGRNGEWYGSAEARSHLVRKLEYIERRGSIATTEQFIELAASKSSMSGAPYQVQCPGAAAVTSASWLSTQLGEVRKTAR